MPAGAAMMLVRGKIGWPGFASVQTGEPQVEFVPTAQSHFVRKTGSDANGGSSLAVLQSGTDGATGGTTFTSATAAFSGTDVNELIMLTGVGRYRIIAIVNANTVTLSAPAPAQTGITWKEGGTCLTMGALLSAGNEAVREGDTIYIGAGTYRESVDVKVATHNAGVVSVVGDVDGAQTGDSGMVMLTAFVTSDATVPTTRGGTLRLNGVSGLSFQNLVIVGFSSVVGFFVIDGSVVSSQGIRFTNCAILMASPAGGGVALAAGYGPLGFAMDRCLILKYGISDGAITFSYISPIVGADVNLASQVKNTVFDGAQAVVLSKSGPGSGVAGGVTMDHLTIRNLMGSNTVTFVLGSSVFPSAITNSLIISPQSTALAGSAGGSLTEDYNVIIATTARSNVSVGAHSFSDLSHPPILAMGIEQIWGALQRFAWEPLVGSSVLGFGNDGSQTAYDALNRPRPAGGGNSLPAVGALERGNSFAKETGTVHTGSNAISAIGAAYQDFFLPVTSGVTYTPSIYSNRDGSYTGMNPQISVVNGSECGVADQTVTAGGAASSWVQITLAPFVPTSDGIVTIRLLANDTSGVAETVFDTFAAT